MQGAVDRSQRRGSSDQAASDFDSAVRAVYRFHLPSRVLNGHRFDIGRQHGPDYGGRSDVDSDFVITVFAGTIVFHRLDRTFRRLGRRAGCDIERSAGRQDRRFSVGQSVDFHCRFGLGGRFGDEQAVDAQYLARRINFLRVPDYLSLIHISEPTRPY